MKDKLRIGNIISISLMLFAMFFGAGNMIFPPALGQNAGSNVIAALLGFVVSDAGIAIMGITAVVLVGSTVSDLARLVSKRFALFLPMLIYLLIGPLFALPRTGSVSYELAFAPFMPEGIPPIVASMLVTGAFFALTYYLSSNPKRIVDIVGKILTPVLLGTIAFIFVGSLLQSPSQIGQGTFGSIQEPIGVYQTQPFFQGMIEGYLALDGPAGLAFSIVVITAIQNLGVTNKKAIVKYTCLCGFGAAICLSVVYFALAYVGAITPGTYGNGGVLLTQVTSHLFGTPGVMVLGLAVLLACLTTSIGLTTSFSDYFVSVYPNITYKKVACCVCLFSFVIANVGLTQLIGISLPILIMIYPVTVVLMVLSFFKRKIKTHRMVYVMGMCFAFVVAFVSGMESAGISLGFLSTWMQGLPFYELGIGWILPAILGALLGFLPCFTSLDKRLAKE